MKSKENTGPPHSRACLLACFTTVHVCSLHTPEVLALALAVTCFLLFRMLFPSFFCLGAFEGDEWEFFVPGFL
jgi:hypothetical protein